MKNFAAVLVGGLVAAFCLYPAGQTVAQAVPAHLDILTAVVQELPPLDPEAVGSRTVVVELELAGAPTCGVTTGFLAYGVFIDSDQDPLTGTTGSSVAPLGVDARVSAECDGGTGLFTTNTGTVAVTAGMGGTTLVTITTVVGDLPAVEFDWIAFAQENFALIRLPSNPDFATWAIIERTIP